MDSACAFRFLWLCNNNTNIKLVTKTRTWYYDKRATRDEERILEIKENNVEMEKKNLSRPYGSYPHGEQMSRQIHKGKVVQNVKGKGRNGKYAGKI